MLVLTRKTDEKIMIGNDIEISILGIEGNSVKIGINAPKDVAILRMEVFENIKNENIASASGQMEDISEAVDILKTKLLKE